MMAIAFHSPRCLLYLTMFMQVLPQVANQVQFTSQYSGSVVFGNLGASVNFVWTFTGNLRVATWVIKRTDGLAIKDKLLVSLNKNGSLQMVLPPRYNGRVKGSWDGKSPGRLTFTLTSIQKDDNIILLCKIFPLKIHFSSVIDKVQLIVTERAFKFTQKRADTLYFQEGSTANLTWTYSVDDRVTELLVIAWSIFNKTHNSFVALILEEKDGTVKHNPNPPPTYGPERVTKEGQASLVIKNVTFKDSTTYKCLLRGEKGTPDLENSVDVIITGHPFVFPLIQAVREGENATLTCNATGVPGQNITWKRKTGQKELQIINDVKHEIISSGFGTSQLTVNGISIEDQGYYVCDTSAIVNQPSLARGFLGVLC